MMAPTCSLCGNPSITAHTCIVVAPPTSTVTCPSTNVLPNSYTSRHTSIAHWHGESALNEACAARKSACACSHCKPLRCELDTIVLKLRAVVADLGKGCAR